MTTRAPFGVGEWYHCYNRGVDKRRVFLTESDYRRFKLLLYLCNDTQGAHVSNLHEKSLEDLVNDSKFIRRPLVSIGAYCLMPNHFHIALMERAESGISLFMQKVMTGYTMYFNKKHDRTGSLFAGTFKSKHIDSDRYFKHLVSYIHLNPAELTDTEWKNGRASVNHIKNALASFPHSSLLDYEGITRAENAILSGELNSLYEEKPRLQEIISSAHEYYQQNLSEV